MKLGGLFLLASLLTLNTRLQAMGVCEEQCREDPDCAAGEKCVSDGCGRVCSPAPQASICVNECREDRDCGIEKECLQVGCQRVCLPLATAASGPKKAGRSVPTPVRTGSRNTSLTWS
ncbi:PREDICTED: WAP four-disulfide core domain protein 3 isoform X3 [Capra hircus]|uniref:WAP four-disulfide core domain protein 3 isoform X3 n=1 Tax=Capra hircus TaxID=9925 RepID=UPI0008465D5F|nr:PREDICTED: WAP four-disulfide core domain protein 3 isoform X3 [Capra hircus]